MRIAIFSESYEPVVNGVSVSIATLRDNLRKRGHKVFAFAPAYRGHKDTDPDVFRFRSWHTPAARDYPLAIPYSPRIKSRFRELQPDIVHTHTPFMLGILGLRWGRWLGLPVVSTNHTLYAEYSHYVPLLPREFVRGIVVWHLRRYYNACDAVAVPSQPVADLLRSYGITKPIEAIQTGVDGLASSGADEDIRAKYGIPSDARLIVYAGRLAKEKNLGLLFAAFADLAPKFPDAVLLLAGGGPAADECRQEVARLGLNGRVIFTGLIPRTEVQTVCRAGQVFAFPSTTDTQAVVVCEALCSGLPCVAVREGGTPEMVRDGVDGFLTANSREEFGARIAQLLSDDELRRRMSVEAAASASRFSEARMAERFERFYARIISMTQARKDEGLIGKR